MGWVHPDPPFYFAAIDFAPCVAGFIASIRGASSKEVTADVAGGDAEVSTGRKHDVGKILAHAAPECHDNGTGAVNIGHTRLVDKGVVDVAAN